MSWINNADLWGTPGGNPTLQWRRISDNVVIYGYNNSLKDQTMLGILDQTCIIDVKHPLLM